MSGNDLTPDTVRTWVQTEHGSLAAYETMMLAVASAWEAYRASIDLTLEMLLQGLPSVVGGGLYRSVERLVKQLEADRKHIEALAERLKEAQWLIHNYPSDDTSSLSAIREWAKRRNLFDAAPAQEKTG